MLQYMIDHTRMGNKMCWNGLNVITNIDGNTIEMQRSSHWSVAFFGSVNSVWTQFQKAGQIQELDEKYQVKRYQTNEAMQSLGPDKKSSCYVDLFPFPLWS